MPGSCTWRCAGRETASSPRGQQAVKAFTSMIETIVADRPEAVRTNRHLLALGMIGALQELLIEWVLADDPPETDRLISTAVHIFHRSFAT